MSIMMTIQINQHHFSINSLINQPSRWRPAATIMNIIIIIMIIMIMIMIYDNDNGIYDILYMI